MKRWMIAALVLLVVGGAACSSRRSAGHLSVKAARAPAEADTTAQRAGGAAGLLNKAGITRDQRLAVPAPKYAPLTVPAPGSPAPAAGSSGSALPPLPDRIVKNSDLTLEVRKGTFDDAWSKVLQAAGRYGGYLAGASRAKSAPKEPLRGDITLRIPAARFEAALVDLRKLGKVTGDATSTEDVTQEFVDLDARIRNLQAQEAVLLKLMERARTIGETLTVQSPLSRTQEQIEELIGRRNALRTLTDYSTLNVHLAEPGAPAPPKPRKGFAQAWHTAIDGLEGMGAVAFVGGIWAVPLGIVIIAAIAIRRRFRMPSLTS